MYLDRRFKTYKEQKAFLLDARIKCDASLLFFTKFFFKEITGNKFIVNEHHKVICKELKRVENYELDLLNINIPPRFSKTELAAVNFIARGIGMNPNGNYLYITASDELRAQTSVSIRDIVTHPFFKMMYGVELKKDQNGKNLWRTKQGGGLKTATIFGQITGFGAGIMNDTLDELRTFEGCIVLDDINKLDDSEAQNATSEKVTRVVFNTVLSRKNSKDTPIINIQQRAGLSDVTAEFENHYGTENERAKFLVMPVISDEGVPLWEWKHDLADIDKLRTSERTAHVFETQYMQNPLPPKGVFFAKHKMSWFSLTEKQVLFNDLEEVYKKASYAYSGNDMCTVTYFDETIVNIRCKGIDIFTIVEYKFGNIDVADEGLDYLSFPIGYVIGERIYITDWLYTQDSTDLTLDRTANLINNNSLNSTGLEANAMGMEFGRRLKPQIKETVNLYPKFSVGRVTKMQRINKQSVSIMKYMVFRNDVSNSSDYGKALKHLFQIKKDGSFKIDDSGDSLAGMFTLAQDLGNENKLPQFKNI